MGRLRQAALEEKQGLLKDMERADALKLHPMESRGRLFDLKDLSLYYGERQACGPVPLSLEPGDRAALNSRNGSGKSTLLKFLCGRISGTPARWSGPRGW